jgi:hypothetical protein
MAHHRFWGRLTSRPSFYRRPSPPPQPRWSGSRHRGAGPGLAVPAGILRLGRDPGVLARRHDVDRGGRDGAVASFEVATGQGWQIRLATRGLIYSLAFARDGTTLAGVTTDEAVINPAA